MNTWKTWKMMPKVCRPLDNLKHTGNTLETKHRHTLIIERDKTKLNAVRGTARAIHSSGLCDTPCWVSSNLRNLRNLKTSISHFEATTCQNLHYSESHTCRILKTTPPEVRRAPACWHMLSCKWCSRLHESTISMFFCGHTLFLIQFLTIERDPLHHII